MFLKPESGVGIFCLQDFGIPKRPQNPNWRLSSCPIQTHTNLIVLTYLMY